MSGVAPTAMQSVHENKGGLHAKPVLRAGTGVLHLLKGWLAHRHMSQTAAAVSVCEQSPPTVGTWWQLCLACTPSAQQLTNLCSLTHLPFAEGPSGFHQPTGHPRPLPCHPATRAAGPGSTCIHRHAAPPTSPAKRRPCPVPAALGGTLCRQLHSSTTVWPHPAAHDVQLVSHCFNLY